MSIRFVDRSPESGITASVHTGSIEKKWIMDANGSGIALLDYDQDGLLDVLVVNGASLDVLQRIMKRQAPAARQDGVFLYRNLGGGAFADVTRTAGLRNPYWGTGANAVDYDGDGYPDILLTNIGRDILYRNQRDGTFKDVSTPAGLTSKVAWHTGSTFGDYDNDGDLDLYIAGYVDVSTLNLEGPAPVCRYLELPVFCGPMRLKGETDVFYRNNGDGTFSDVTDPAGLMEGEPRYGFTAVFEDFNQDGKPDIFVANDSGPNYLYVNTGRGRFTESALISGLAFNADGKSQANMGVALGDVDNDGDLDVLTTTFSEDHFPLFEQTSPGVFEEVSARAGLMRTTFPWLGWACGFVDFDNDGWRDLWLANGHVYPTIAEARRTSYEQAVVVLPNRQGNFNGTPNFIAMRGRLSWRGGAAGDLNNDGKVDLVVSPVDGTAAFLENRSQSSHHWIGFDLRGRAIGASLHVDACGSRSFDTVRNGGSYISSDDPRRHFGLGGCSAVDRVTIRWPSGRRQIVESPTIDQYHVLRENGP